MTGRFALWIRLVKLTWRASPSRCLLCALSFIPGIAGAPVVALMLRDLTNHLLEGRFAAAVPAAATAGLVWMIAEQSNDVRNHLRNDVRERVWSELSEEVMHLVGNIPTLQHLEDPDSLDRIDTVVTRSNAVSDTIWAAAETVASVLAVAATLLVLSTISPLLLLTLPLALPTLWFNRLGRSRIHAAVSRASEHQRTADRLLETIFDPVAAIELRISGASPALLDEYEARYNAATRIIIRARTQSAVLLVTGWAFFLVGFGGALGFTVWRITQGQSSAGDVILLLTIARQLQASVQATVAGFARMIDGVHAARAYRWLVDYAARNMPPAGSKDIPSHLQWGIRTDRVSFAYPGTERVVLRDVSLDFPAGSVVALVGTHGSGKTTLIKLLTGMYAPTQGQIDVEGRSLDQLDTAAWRQHLSCGFQDFARFQALAGEAVGLGDLPALYDEYEVDRAVDQGGARGVIDKLPDGLNTQLGSAFDGVELSGGQWQKLALARTCMRQAPLLVVLDEPTASLDPVSEFDVFQRQMALAREMGARSGTVTVIVSHRFSTVRMADKIVVLADGAVIEEGDHDTLMAMAGRYAELYSLQRDAYTDA